MHNYMEKVSFTYLARYSNELSIATTDRRAFHVTENNTRLTETVLLTENI